MAKNKKIGRNAAVTYQPPAPPEKKRWSASACQIQLFVLLTLSALLYVNTIPADYALDDGLFITDNAVTKKGASGIREILTKDAFYGVFGDSAKDLLPGGRYRPLSQVMFALEVEAFGLNPHIGHVINILFYMLLIFLVFMTLRLLFRDDENKPWYLSIPFIATLLFAAHPLHTEVVANIKGRDELLSLSGAISAVYFSIRYTESGKWKYLLFSFVVFFLAMISKENSVTFMAVLPLTLFVFTKSKLRDYVITLLPLLAGFIVYFIMRYHALGFITNTVQDTELLNNPFIGVDFAHKLATLFYTWGKYLLLLIVPHPLTHDYYPFQIPIIGFADIRAILPLITFVLLAIFALIRILKKDVIAYGILFFLITFSISSNLVFNIGTFMNERFMFAPLLGFTLIMAWFISNRLPVLLKNRQQYLTAVKILLIIVMTGYSVKTFTRNFAWKDTLTLYTTDVKTSVNSAKCNVAAGEMIIKNIGENEPEEIKNKKYQEAMAYLDRGLKMYPQFKSGWVYMGYAQRALKDFRSSRESFEKVLKLAPNDADAIKALDYDSHECFKNGDVKLAVQHVETLIRYVADNLQYYYLKAEIYENLGKTDSCVMILNYILEKKPDYDKALNKLGEIYGRDYNDLARSLDYLNKAFAANPHNPDVLKNLGTASGLKGEYEKALQYLLEAEKGLPDSKEVLTKIAISYQNLGKADKASEYIQKANAAKGK